jgi:hypothetical protein
MWSYAFARVRAAPLRWSAAAAVAVCAVPVALWARPRWTAARAEGRVSPLVDSGAAPANSPDWVRHLLAAGAVLPFGRSRDAAAGSPAAAERDAHHLLRGPLNGPGLIEFAAMRAERAGVSLPAFGPTADPSIAAAIANDPSAVRWPSAVAVLKLGDRMCGHPNVIHGVCISRPSTPRVLSAAQHTRRTTHHTSHTTHHRTARFAVAMPGRA